MSQIKVRISGEDKVTVAIIERLLLYVSARFEVMGTLPARGGEVKNKIKELNELAKTTPVILLADVDNGCPPSTKASLLEGLTQSSNFIINLAVDEGEAWLMADRMNFARFLSVNIDEIPQPSMIKQGGRNALIEIDCGIKSSFYLTHTLILKSTDDVLKKQIKAKGTACKGPEYNSAILPFIENDWNIENAMLNSDSLTRMVGRLRSLEARFQ